jgi:hypothetical protein
MEKKFTFKRKISFSFSSSSSYSSASYTPETKSDIIARAIGNPANKSNAQLSQNNEHLLGSDIAHSLIKRHNYELQRCSQFYSLASLFNEKSSKDKHRFQIKNIRKMSSTGRKYISRLFMCF